MLPGVELLTRNLKSWQRIRRPPMATCPRHFDPRVRTVPVCNVGDTSEADVKTFGLAELVPLAITHPRPPGDPTAATGGCSRGTQAIATVNLSIKLPELYVFV